MQIEQGNNLPRIKLSNQASIRRMIYYYGPITRSEISSRLNLTLPTITTNINSLIANGLVREVDYPEEIKKALGRRAYPVDIVADARYFIGVEMRGTLRSLCVTDYRGKVYYFAKDETPLTDYRETIRSTCELISEAVSANSVPLDKIAQIGFCLPGLVDSKNGILNIHPGYHWIDKDIRADLAALTGFLGPISVENNSCARAFAAQLFQRNLLDSVPTFAYMFISAGIACPFIINNFSEMSAPIGVGEAGHMVMNPNGPTCSCGNHGCLEAFSSDVAVLTRSAQALLRAEAPILASITQERAPTMLDVLQAQKAGEKSIQNIISEAVFYLGLALANIDNFVRPHTIFVDGMLFRNEENRHHLIQIIQKNLYRATLTDINFHFMEADEFSGARAAAAVAIRDDLGGYIEYQGN